MASELQITAKMSFNEQSSTQNIVISELNVNIDVSGTKFSRNVQTINTSETAVEYGDVSSPGFCFIKNLDDTNYVNFRGGTAETDFLKLKPGETAGPFRLASTTMKAQANSAAVDCDITIIEA